MLLKVLITFLMKPRLKKLSESAQQEAHDKHSVLVETLSGLETVKLLGAGGLLRKRFKSVVTQQAKSADETKRHTFFSTNLTAEIQQAGRSRISTSPQLMASAQDPHGELKSSQYIGSIPP